jgi:hypothetical protein
MTKSKRYVVIATSSRPWSVVCGRLVAEYDGGSVDMEDVRMAVYWPTDTRAVFGLASSGPPPGSRITPALPEATVRGVELMLAATDAAVAAWKGEPWS